MQLDLPALKQTAQSINSPQVAIWLAPLLMFCSGFLLMLLSGKPLIAWLQNKRWRKDATDAREAWEVREDTPDTHQKKRGTPSMGGIGIIGSAVFAYVAVLLALYFVFVFSSRNQAFTFNAYEIASILLVPLFVGAFALLGFADDWSKASGRGGLQAREKLLGQVGLSLIFGAVWLALYATQSYQTVRYVFFGLNGALQNFGVLGVLEVGALAAFLIVAASNAVNLTDGIDGLAAGLCVQVGLAFLLATETIAPGEIGLLSNLMWLSLTGACLGFLVYNRFPARVFMGDTGSLALGAALGIGAILTRNVFLLPFVGFVFWLEMASVIFQVGYFKYTKKRDGEGKRLLRRAPLHHHFELGGWSEWRVVATLWGVNAVATMIGLLLMSTEILPRFP